IDWARIKGELLNKVLLPVLPDQYGRALEAGAFHLELIEGAFVVRYAGSRLPINPNSYVLLLTHRAEVLAARLDAEHPHRQELQSIITALGHLPDQTETDPTRIGERLREKEVIKRRLAALVKESAEIRE